LGRRGNGRNERDREGGKEVGEEGEELGGGKGGERKEI
jgi:hypothetical protein